MSDRSFVFMFKPWTSRSVLFWDHSRYDSWIELCLVTLTQILSFWIEKYLTWTSSHRFRYDRWNLCILIFTYFNSQNSVCSSLNSTIKNVSFLYLMLKHHCCLLVATYMWSRILKNHRLLYWIYSTRSHTSKLQTGIENSNIIKAWHQK